MDGSLKSSDLSLEVLGGASHNKVSELKEENINYDSDNEFGSIDLNFDDKDCLSGIDSSIDECFNDKGPPLDDDIIDAIGSENNLITLSQKEDNIFSEIKDFITRRKSGSRSQSSLTNSDSTTHVRTSSQFSSIPYGIIPKASYEHGNMCSDIMGVTYNNRMRQFIILDAKGITTWKRDAVDHRVNRVLEYPKYEYKLITHLVYAKKHNCYFGLGKDFSLKVFNRDFMETCSVSADLRSVLFMLFNPVRDELITGGVGGTKVWQFHQQAGKAFGSLRPLGNYGLTLKQELPNVGGGWVKRVDLDYNLEHLYCCSDTGLHVYDLDGKEILKFESAHSMTITGCRYSQYANFLVTCSVDCEVKVWSVLGGLVHTFRGHSRAVTSLMLHPATSSIVITCSLDGSIRMWSLDTMECHYSIVVSVDGVLWMGQTDDNILYLCTARTLTLWNINYCVQFCAHARSNVTSLSCCGGKDKTTRLMVISEDSSVRLMARSNMKNMSTVLPPPSISPLQKVMSVCYSRQRNTMYLLIDPYEIWVYTTRTDPACRIAVWDVSDLQRNFISTKTAVDKVEDVSSPARTTFNKPPPSHRATEGGSANQPIANCCCLAVLNSDAIFWSAQGKSCTEQDVFLLLGLEVFMFLNKSNYFDINETRPPNVKPCSIKYVLNNKEQARYKKKQMHACRNLCPFNGTLFFLYQDGRILFMDPVVKAQKYLEFKTGKDAVLDISHDVNHNSLHTLYKVKGMMLVHIWNLPDLELQNEVYMAPDLEAYTRLDNSLFTGYTSGCVLFHSLEKVKDIGLNKARMLPNVEDVVETHHKPEHLAPITTVDVCISLKLFCSCSNDGAIKIWTEDGSLLTEIMLDSSLTTACFLNNMGDLVIGFQKHLFFIDHSKIYSQMVVPESDMDTFDKESVIYEDPAVMYEGIIPYPDPITLENYLVPFDIEFSKDFFEGKVELEPQSLKPVEIERASRASMAPTEIYVSPDATPRRRLSLVDLTVDSSVTNGDLADFMHKTIEHMEEKDKRDMRQMHFELKRESESRSSALRRKLRVKLKLINAGNKKDAPPKEQATKKKQAEQLKFSFPRFGKSPGPTPESSSPPTPDLMSEPEDLLVSFFNH
ncbi:unnamed protein product [Lymnaea stagnalis]|uniref:Uncharacterized protein n=1 Tax=Lymnaea stagnalis TaxID=6523 RepID=A0AAV2HMU2_LYMST